MIDIAKEITELRTLTQSHTDWRGQCLNLIASENTPSPFVEGLITEVLNRRYSYYIGLDPRNQHYQGSKFAVEIEAKAQELARELFDVRFVELRPLSGNIAGIIATFALGSPGDTVLEIQSGHRYAYKMATSSLKVDLKSIPIPFDGLRYNIDMPYTVDLIREHKPKLVIVGSAIFLFPHPVKALRQAMDECCQGSYLIYDAAHVMGLIAGGRFQQPLQEGADVVITSTHKTLAGPQGGMILTNDQKIAERMAEATSPLMIANHHLARLPSLAATFLEWLAHGVEHADAIIRNAKGLGMALGERGVPMVGAELDYTESHTLLAIVDAFGDAQELADSLEEQNIVLGATSLPEEVGKQGLRLGVQEMTRWGMTKDDLGDVADCIVDGLQGEDPDGVKKRAVELAQRFNKVRFAIEEREGR